jgi:hypothetical protein
MTDAPARYTAKDWDEVRLAFASSLMVDISISSLAQNLDSPDWPIKRPEETPTAYIDLTYEEVCELLALKGFPTHADLLISILKDTLAFDDPFGDMVQQTAAAGERDNALLKNMAKLEVPESFPIGLTALDEDTREFCRLEKLQTLGEFARFAQGLAQNVIVGGDFKRLLNALSHVDEATLAQLLPFRRGAKGLHLIECLAQGGEHGPERARLAADWFRAEFAALENDLAAGGKLARQLMVLDDPAAESRVAAVLRPLLKGGAAAAVEGKKSGWFGGLARWLGK